MYSKRYEEERERHPYRDVTPLPRYTQEQIDRMEEERQAILFTNFGFNSAQQAKMVKRLMDLGQVQKIGYDFYWIDTGERM